MTSITYDEIFSGFAESVEAYDFITKSDEEIKRWMCSWIHRALAKPSLFRLFKSLTYDDVNGSFAYELEIPVNEITDKDFVTRVVVLGVILEWITPKILSITTLAQRFGSKDEKFYSQKEHLSGLRELKASINAEQNQLIGDRTFSYNTYLTES